MHETERTLETLNYPFIIETRQTLSMKAKNVSVGSRDRQSEEAFSLFRPPSLVFSCDPILQLIVWFFRSFLPRSSLLFALSLCSRPPLPPPPPALHWAILLFSSDDPVVQNFAFPALQQAKGSEVVACYAPSQQEAELFATKNKVSRERERTEDKWKNEKTEKGGKLMASFFPVLVSFFSLSLVFHAISCALLPI